VFPRISKRPITSPANFTLFVRAEVIRKKCKISLFPIIFLRNILLDNVVVFYLATSLKRSAKSRRLRRAFL